jgi:DNA mismatch repair protein MutS2
LQHQDLNTIDWPSVVQKLKNFATSEIGRELLEKIQPLPSSQKCLDSFFRISEVKVSYAQSGVRPFMESLDLYSVWNSRLKKEAVLTTVELKDVRHFLVEVQALKATLAESNSEYLNNQAEQIFEAIEPLSAIDQIMTPDGGIRTDASETLYKLFSEKVQKGRDVTKILDRLVHEQDLAHVLQDKYVTTREGRWVLPVKSGMQSQFDGIIHASSQSKQTVFMEPKEVIKINNRLREVESEIEQEIERLLMDLSRYLQDLILPIESAQKHMLDLDLLYAKAQLANLTKAHAVQFSDNALNLIDLRHPLLALDASIEVTANTVHLDTSSRILILSGPNAGGKTVLLKSVGLAAHMARCGLLVCAEEQSSLPFFENIYVGVGDSQSVDSHLSTFAAHLKILDRAAKAQGSQQLLLIDEICGSTDPEEGTALARSFIQKFAANKVFGVVTSHLGPLKIGWDKSSGVINGSLEYNSETGQPTYQFLTGIPGQSLAIQTAKRVGVATDIVDTAMQFLSPETKKYLLSIDELESQKQELRNLKADLQKQTKELNKEKSKYHALAQRFEKEKSDMLRTVVTRAEKKIDRLVEFSKVDDIFKKHTSSQTIKNQIPRVIKATSSSTPAIERVEEFERAFPPGSKVYAPTIGKDGIVQGPPNGKGEVPILAQSMRLMLLWSDLQSPMAPGNPTQKILNRTQSQPPTLALPDQNLDLRGFKVEQALEHLELHLDKAASHHLDRIKIIHGHGTDALKRAVRSYLSRSLYVKKWSSGQSELGGDGITWVEIKD